MTDRVEDFRTDVAGLSVSSGVPESERRLLVASIVLAVLGVLALVAGYWGASGTRELSEQIPFVISGGLVGVALVFAAAILFARYSLARLARFWLARLIVEELYELVRQIAESGVSILVVEQFARTVLGVADYAAIMLHGRITSVGQPDDIAPELEAAYMGAG